MSIDWGYPRPIDGNFGCATLGEYQNATFIALLNVWGEGRVIESDQKMVTGFTQAFNLNHVNKKVGTVGNHKIPNLIPIGHSSSRSGSSEEQKDYNDP